MIFEFAQLYSNDIEVISSNTKKNKIVVTTISRMLTDAFGPADLGIKLEKYRKD